MLLNHRQPPSFSPWVWLLAWLEAAKAQSALRVDACSGPGSRSWGTLASMHVCGEDQDAVSSQRLMSTLGRVAAILRVSFDAARAGDCSRQPQSASRPALVGLEAVVGAADIDARASDCFAATNLMPRTSLKDRSAPASCLRPRAAVRRRAIVRVSADRYGSHGRRWSSPLGGQGRPKAAGGERLLLLQLRATCSARPISQRELHRGPPRSRCIHVSRYADSVEQPDASRLHIPSDFRSVVRRERTLENGQLG